MPPRRSPRLPTGFTLGGRVPPPVGLLIVLLAGSTIFNWIVGFDGMVSLDPERLVQGEFWRLVTWMFVQRRGDVFGLLFGALALWQNGTALCYAWGEGRFLARCFILAVAASVVTTLLASVWAPAGQPHLGVWPVAIALMFSWARLHPDAQVQLMLLLPMTGRAFGTLILVGTVLYGVAMGGLRGIGLVVPHLAALGLAWAWSRGTVLPTRRWRMQLRDWWQEREFKRRSKHLKVIRKNGSGDEPPRWTN